MTSAACLREAKVQKRKPKLTPTERLSEIAAILEAHDNMLLAEDGPVTQEPFYLRKVYLLAKRKSR